MSIFTIQPDVIYTKADFPAFHWDMLYACGGQGDQTTNVERAKHYFALGDAQATAYALKQYGAWDADELSDNDANLGRVLWVMAGQLRDEGEAYLGI